MMAPAVNPDRARLRSFWNARYSDFTLSESGWMGAGEDLNRFIYDCKARALTRSLSAIGLHRGTSFRVLDAGCGQGFFARLYASEFPQASYTGVDISERAIRHLQASGIRGDFHVGDLATWSDPHAPGFDVVQSLEVIHLILDDDTWAAALANLARQLNAGGHLLLTAALPAATIQRGDYLRYRSRALWTETLRTLNLQVVSARPVYYWLPSGGPGNRYLRFLSDRMGVRALYALDRAALTMRLPHPHSSGPDNRMQLLTIQRIRE